MNEAVGNALLFNLVIIFVIILSAFFISSLAYTKAYKVKNRIVEEIEKNGEETARQFTTFESADSAYANAKNEIEAWLNGSEGQGIGYKKTNGYNTRCNNYTNDLPDNAILQNHAGNYSYCVYKISTCGENNTATNDCGIYYHVITFMYVDFPLVEEFPLPIHGETKTFKIKKS